MNTWVSRLLPTSYTHDKGERKGLGCLIRLLAFLNKNRLLDLLFHDRIISLWADSDGVKLDDKSIVHHLALSLKWCEPYLNHNITCQISSFTTDHGGGRGTKEGCANEFRLNMDRCSLLFGMSLLVCYMDIQNLLKKHGCEPLVISELGIIHASTSSLIVGITKINLVRN